MCVCKGNISFSLLIQIYIQRCLSSRNVEFNKDYKAFQASNSTNSNRRINNKKKSQKKTDECILIRMDVVIGANSCIKLQYKHIHCRYLIYDLHTKMIRLIGLVSTETMSISFNITKIICTQHTHTLCNEFISVQQFGNIFSGFYVFLLRIMNYKCVWEKKKKTIFCHVQPSCSLIFIR